ncbi:hypothetical protein BU15DRAFT_54964 [Melanogaster broomeanus]|nr:hypothetical protein BU15DRAFT_54964 [Melanogaster broomeanus]
MQPATHVTQPRSVVPQTAVVSVQPPSSHQSSHSSAGDGNFPSPNQHAAASSALAHDPASMTRMLQLGDGTILTFTMADVGDPSAVSFCRDIARLNAMWDDSSPDWQGDSVLVIKGHPIAIKHWPEVYRYAWNQQWQGTKHKWGCWRDITERYRQGTPDDFWREFSEDGTRMSYTRILARLHETRVKEAEEKVQKAGDELGHLFDQQCTYRKGSETHVLTRPWAVVRRLQALGEAGSRNGGHWL